MRRGWVFGLALLLFLAVVGPACLASAMTAFAMPVHTAPATPTDCDGPGSGMKSCPHSETAKVSADSVKADPIAPVAVVVTAEDLLPGVTSDPLHTRAEVVRTPPPTHLTPLRL